MSNTAWFNEAKYGLFIHWGLYAIWGRGEWVMRRDGIEEEEYNALAEQWNPQKGTIDDWCRIAAEGGMRYAVFTTRHHDGFSLFDTKSDAFNSMNSPCHCDHVAEYVQACRKYGLKVGFYYSLVDWRLKERPEEMKKKVWTQLEELMTHYGQIDMLWYDGCYPSVAECAEFFDSENLNAMIKKLQPGILINNRSCVTLDFSDIEGRNIIRRPEGAKLWELCMTLEDDDFSYWGYCRRSVFRKTPEQALLLLLHCMEHGGNLLLNVSPDGNGVVPEWQQEVLQKVGVWVNKHADEVYGTEDTDIGSSKPGLFGCQGNSCGFFTKKDGKYFFYLHAWPGTEIRLPYFNAKLKSVTYEGRELDFVQAENGSVKVMGLPDEPPEDWCPVVHFMV